MNKFGRAVLAAALLFLAVAPASRAATGRAECLSLQSKILGRQVPYCALLPPSYDADKTRRYPILYFLHGLGDNEQSFVRSGGWNLTEDLWEQNKLSEFLIVTPAGDASFYINSLDGRSRYEDFLLREFIPQIERRYRTNSDRSTRGIGGISMGGYGALHLAFQHPELFVSVSAQSAALIEKLPEITPGDSRRMGRLQILGSIFGSPPDADFWEHNNPLTMAHKAKLAGLKIYFDCGSEDDYGFDAGAAVLDKALTARRVSHEFHLYPGRHDWTYFASHLGEVLQFHAHAFAAPQVPK